MPEEDLTDEVVELEDGNPPSPFHIIPNKKFQETIFLKCDFPVDTSLKRYKLVPDRITYQERPNAKEEDKTIQSEETIH